MKKKYVYTIDGFKFKKREKEQSKLSVYISKPKEKEEIK